MIQRERERDREGKSLKKDVVYILADSLKPCAEWTITWRKPYRPGVSSSETQHREAKR